MSLHIPVAIILLGGGLLACFLGYRLLRILLAVYGFVAGVIIATLFVEQFEETWMAVLVTIGAGLAGLVLATVAYLAGVGLLGAALGAVALNVAWSYRGGEPEVWLVLVACFAGALVAPPTLPYAHNVIIVGTSSGCLEPLWWGGLRSPATVRRLRRERGRCRSCTPWSRPAARSGSCGWSARRTWLSSSSSAG